jgi:6-pyruvoyltetrahydropterin/6-carboxytetrahydropterin synthase
MPSASITKRFDFHAAHILRHHDGACARLHGHTYFLDVTVEGMIKPPNGDSDEGMVIDFGELKKVYKDHIEPLVEHQFLNDTLFEFLPREEAGDAITTAENMAWWMAGLFSRVLEREVTVSLWETPTSKATVTRADWD